VAGEWIKVETTTFNKPEILRMAGALNLSRNLVFGNWICLWIWFDQHTSDGNAKGVTTNLLDSVLGVEGFCKAAHEVGWLEPYEGGVRLPKFSRHNGKTAKKRILTARRVAAYKKRHANDDSVTSALPREEKRRVKNKTAPPSGGSTIWDFGRALLIEQGLTATSSGALMGSWLREWTEADVSDALRSAAGKADVRSYVAAILKTKPKKGATAELKVAMP
jgi:hypothetical protein